MIYGFGMYFIEAGVAVNNSLSVVTLLVKQPVLKVRLVVSQ